ncbi:MAG: putative ABC transporter permease [Eggerthellaceae bacterium]|nr:putative ABC transporter permease [Eggerthellaceae bacterium]
MLSAPVDSERLPLAMKVFGVLCVLGTLFAMYEVVLSILHTVDMFQHGSMSDLGISTVVVTFVWLVDIGLLMCAFAVMGVRILLNQRRFAALVIYGIYVFLLLGAICSLMLFGVSLRLVIYGVLFVLLVAFQIYLDPSLREERELQHKLHDKELKTEQEEGVLGRDLSGKGYMALNFFNLFWLFVIASFLGDVMESIVHVTIVDPGHWQDRAGLLFGPFSPIYGCGAILMTLALNRFYKSNVVLIFFVSAIIGGAFEFFVSLFMQYTFGAVAWNYTGQFLSIDGRTCGWAMGCWGLLGVAWIKLLLPGILWLVNKIPWNWRYWVTIVAACLMAVDCVMSLQALDCWYERLSNDPVNTPIQHFYADHFNNTYMEDRFQSMTVNPGSAVRGGKV